MANFFSKLFQPRDAKKEAQLHEGVQAIPAAEGFWAAVGKRAPSAPEARDLPIVDQAEWNVQKIRSSVYGHVSGQFGNAALLADAMLGDDRIQGATNGRTKGITSVETVISPAKVDDQVQAKTIALEIENYWDEMFPESTIEEILKWQIFAGFTLCNLVWAYKNDRYIPYLKVFHPLYIYYNYSTRKYTVFTMDGAIEIEPNDPSWFLYTPYGSYRGWMRGAVRSVSIPWVVRQFALRDWARYSEVHGLPQKKAKVPAMAPAEDKRRFFNAVKRLGSESAFLLPMPMNNGSGAEWDVELLEATDRSWQGFEKLIERCDKSITLCIRGTNLTTEVQTGTGAATKAHREEDSDYAMADAKKLAMAIRKQVLMQYCLYNYGDALLAPIPSFEAEPVEDKQASAKVMVDVATALKTLKTEVGWEVDDKAIAEQFGIPLKGVRAPTAPAQTDDSELPQE